MKKLRLERTNNVTFREGCERESLTAFGVPVVRCLFSYALTTFQFPFSEIVSFILFDTAKTSLE